MFLLGIATVTCFQLISAAPSAVTDYLNRTTCETADCYEAANYLIYAINASANPCENFYDFVCGNYIANTVIPDGEDFINLIQEVVAKVETNIKNIIEENSAVLDTKASRLIEQLHKGCLNTYGDTTSISLAIESIGNLLHELGGWPVLQNDNWSHIDWKEITYALRRKGATTNDFIPLYIDYDLYNTTRYTLNVYIPYFVISQGSLQDGLNNDEVQAYKRKILYLTEELGATDMIYTEEMVVKVLEFEIELAKIAVETQSTNKTIAELEGSYPNIPWMVYLTNIIASPNVTLSNQDVVNIASIGYIQNLNRLLENTSPEILGSYLQFRAIVDVFDLVGAPWSKSKPNSNRNIVVSFVETRTAKIDYSTTCIDLVKNKLPIALSALYVKKYMTSSIKNDIVDMILKLKDAFIRVIDDNTWYDAATKEKAIVKVRAMGYQAGYPDELLDEAVVDEYYEKLNLDENFVNLQFNIQKFAMDELFGKVKDVPDKADWRTHSAIAVFNAYYYPVENGLQILAGILQNPMFRHTNPNYMNYAAIGSVIGHEINHGFDADGSQYDEFGQLNNWFTQDSAEEYKSRTNCLYEQYLAQNNNPQTSQLTLNEDIADAGGVESAYTAYQTWVSNNHEESLLPGLNYAPNQLFWISYARIWCANETQNYIEKISPYQIHSRGKYRALIPLTNSPKFAEDFNCPADSFMNPSHKCKVW